MPRPYRPGPGQLPLDPAACAERLAAYRADRRDGTTTQLAAVMRRQLADAAPDPDPETVTPREDYL